MPTSLIEAIQLYSLNAFLLFYLLNHSKILSKPREWCGRSLPKWLRGAFSCSLCFTFWLSLSLMFLGAADLVHVTAAPVLVMFLNLIYLKLVAPAPAITVNNSIQPPILPKS